MLRALNHFKGVKYKYKYRRPLHSSPKFSLPRHLLTAGLFQEFLFCLYSTYLCALGSTSLPCLLAMLRWCRRYRENSVLSTMAINIRLSLFFFDWLSKANQVFKNEPGRPRAIHYLTPPPLAMFWGAVHVEEI